MSVPAGTLVVPTGLQGPPGQGGGGGGAALDYLTSEQNTGSVWLDGSPVYVKTISLGNLTGPNSVKQIPHAIHGLTRVVDVNAIITHAGQWVPLTRASPGTVNIWVDLDHVCVESGAASRHDWQGWATVYYTRA